MLQETSNILFMPHYGLYKVPAPRSSILDTSDFPLGRKNIFNGCQKGDLGKLCLKYLCRIFLYFCLVPSGTSQNKNSILETFLGTLGVLRFVTCIQNVMLSGVI